MIDQTDNELESTDEQYSDEEIKVNYLINLNRTSLVFFNTCEIFTDGSKKRNGKSGSSFTLNNLTTGHIVYQLYRLNDNITSCVSEMSAIYQALIFLISSEVLCSKIDIYTDFQRAATYLNDRSTKKVLGKKSRINLLIFREKINILRSNHNLIQIKWIKKNTNLLNTYADRFAKEGSNLKRINFDVKTIQI